MALPKLFDLITWHNNTTPALNEDNLNAMSQAIDDIDDRVIDLAGTIMEDVPQIQEDMAILGPAVENIDENVARAEAAAESAEQYAEEIAPPIEVVKDYAPIITIEDAINKAAKDVKVKVDAVQDLHGYTKPWVGGAGKNKYSILAGEDNVSTNDGATKTTDADKKLIITTSASGAASGVYYAPTTTLRTTAAAMSGANISFDIVANVPVTVSIGTGDSGAPTRKSINVTTTKQRVFYNEYNGSTAFVIYVANTAATITISNMMLTVTTETDTTFEPYTNICPITGHSEVKVYRDGLNIWDEVTESGAINLDTGANSENASIIRTKNYIPLVLGQTYCYNAPGETIIRAAFYDENKAYVDKLSESNIVMPKIFTAPSNARYMRFYFSSTYGTTYKNDTCVNVSNASKNGHYEPYQGNVYTIDLNGTRYGGVLDVDAGTLTLTHEIVDMGTLPWQYTGSPSNRFYAILYDDTYNMKHNSASELSDSICSNYPQVTRTDFYPDGAHDFSYSLSESSSTACALNVRDSNYTQSSDFSTAMSGAQLCYALKVPQTIQLTAEEVTLLLGYNTLFADTGDIALTYDASGVLRIANEKLDIDTFKSIVAASSDFADFKTRVAAL